MFAKLKRGVGEVNLKINRANFYNDSNKGNKNWRFCNV